MTSSWQPIMVGSDKRGNLTLIAYDGTRMVIARDRIPHAVSDGRGNVLLQLDEVRMVIQRGDVDDLLLKLAGQPALDALIRDLTDIRDRFASQQLPHPDDLSEED